VPLLLFRRAGFRPAFLARELIQLSGVSFADLAFASSQDDRIVLESWPGGCELARPFFERDGILASRPNTEVTAPIEMLQSAGEIESPKVLTGL